MNKLMMEFESVLEMVHSVDIGRTFGVDMSKSEFIVMRVIFSVAKDYGEKVLVSDVVNRMKVSAQAISKSLKSLEKKGYIERFSNKEDRRRMEIIVTDKGNETYSHIIKKSDEVLSVVLEQFGEKEFETYICLTRKLTNLYGKAMADMK